MALHEFEVSVDEASARPKNVATVEAQNERIEAMKGKRMLFVGGDFMMKSFAPMLVRMLQKLRALGVVVHSVFQEHPGGPSKYMRDQEAGNCYDFHTFANIGAENGAENVAKAVKEAGWQVDYAYSPHESCQLVTSKIQQLLSMPGNPVAAYEIARDKYRSRKCIADSGLASIQAMQVWKREDATKVAETLGFPVIIKPTVGMGSAGVYRCDNLEELQAKIDQLFVDLKTEWNLCKSTQGGNAPILAETCVIPTTYGGKRVNEHDVEVLLWEGECVYANIIDNWSTKPPFFQEIGSSMPTYMSKEEQQSMIDYAVKCVKAMGFTRGGFHTECWMTANGPLLIEVNPRVGGGATVESHVECFGVNPMFEMILSMLDIPINPPRPAEPLCTYAYLLPNAEKTGMLVENPTFLEVSKESPFYHASTYFKKGCAVRGNDTGIADWLGEVHLKGTEFHQVLDEMERLLQDIEVISTSEITKN